MDILLVILEFRVRVSVILNPLVDKQDSLPRRNRSTTVAGYSNVKLMRLFLLICPIFKMRDKEFLCKFSRVYFSALNTVLTKIENACKYPRIRTWTGNAVSGLNVLFAIMALILVSWARIYLKVVPSPFGTRFPP